MRDPRDPQRFTSLKQRLREVKRTRHHKNSSRASSILTDNTDASSVASEGSPIVEAKLEQLLLQVSAGPRSDPSAAHGLAGTPGRHLQEYTNAGSSNVSRGGSMNTRGVLGPGAGTKQQVSACGGQKGLGVTVRRSVLSK